MRTDSANWDGKTFDSYCFAKGGEDEVKKQGCEKDVVCVLCWKKHNIGERIVVHEARIKRNRINVKMLIGGVLHKCPKCSCLWFVENSGAIAEWRSKIKKRNKRFIGTPIGNFN